MNGVRFVFLLFFGICVYNSAWAAKSESHFAGENSSERYSVKAPEKDMSVLDFKKYGFVFYYNPAQWQLKTTAPTKFDFKFQQADITTTIFTHWAVFPLEYMPDEDLATFKKFVSPTAKKVKSSLSENNGVKVITAEFEMDFQNKPVTCIGIYSVSEIGSVRLQTFIDTNFVDQYREQIILFGRGLAEASKPL